MVMDELIVEGFDYEDFITLKKILQNNTTFAPKEKEELANTLTLIEKANRVIEVFEE